MSFIASIIAVFASVGVQTARLDALYNDDLVVTNVTESGGVDTNAVVAISATQITNDVASWAMKPNPAPVTDLTPAFAYTTAVSNKLEASKQNVIEDLDTIRTGAALGATAVQPGAIADMETKTHAAATFQPKGNYLTSESDPVWTTDKPNYLTSALAAQTYQPIIADLATIRSGAALGATALQPNEESDPTVSEWAKASQKPSYTYDEIGGTFPGWIKPDKVGLSSDEFWIGQDPNAPYPSGWEGGVRYLHYKHGVFKVGYGSYYRSGRNGRIAEIGCDREHDKAYIASVETRPEDESETILRWVLDLPEENGIIETREHAATNYLSLSATNSFAAGILAQSGRDCGAKIADATNNLATVAFTGDWNDLTVKPYIPVISATDPTFSNAVLSVGLNIDTNSVAVLNEIAASFGGFPIEGTATTIGGLLAALAAAVAWLKKKSVKKDSNGYYFED